MTTELIAAATLTAPTSTSALAAAESMMVYLHGTQINLIAVMIFAAITIILILFWSIQKSKRLDLADMITKDGKSVSLTKVLQLLGGVTATWIMIKLTLTGGLTEALFGLYLTYVGAIEGYSKFVAAKYGYQEKSIKSANADDPDAPK